MILLVASGVILTLYIGWGIKLVIFGIPPTILCLLILFGCWISYPVWYAVKHRKSASPRILLIVASVVVKLVLVLLLAGVYFSPLTPSHQFYMEAAEPTTGRVFVAECVQNMMGRGGVQLYERYGPFIVPCETEEYSGQFSPDEPRAYLTDDGTEIYISFFFMVPNFTVPVS